MTKEYSTPFMVPSGSNGKSFDFTPEGGQIKRCVIHLNNGATLNPVMVTAGIKTAGGKDLAKMQPIESFRTRDVQYENDGKPLETDGGSLLTLTIASREQFTDDLHGFIVMVYENEFCG